MLSPVWLAQPAMLNLIVPSVMLEVQVSIVLHVLMGISWNQCKSALSAPP